MILMLLDKYNTGISNLLFHFSVPVIEKETTRNETIYESVEIQSQGNVSDPNQRVLLLNDIYSIIIRSPQI